MYDRFGRCISYLRISITQNCNMQCIYCTPQGTQPARCPDVMTPEEYGVLVGAMAGMGIKKVRITGGEPLVRTDICEIISRVSSVAGIEEVAMTTNGLRLDKMAAALKKAGLNRLNVSLDSLKADRFEYMTGGGRLSEVTLGIRNAVGAKTMPVRINTVLIKGLNDDEVDDFINLTKDEPLDVRFIELMPFGKFSRQNGDRVVFGDEIISAHPELKYCGDDFSGQPARYYRIDGHKGRVGFISPIGHKFCNVCNKIRLTSDGKIRACLGSDTEVSVLEALRGEREGLLELIEKIIYEKPEGHNFDCNFRSARDMNMIGG